MDGHNARLILQMGSWVGNCSSPMLLSIFGDDAALRWGEKRSLTESRRREKNGFVLETRRRKKVMLFNYKKSFKCCKVDGVFP